MCNLLKLDVLKLNPLPYWALRHQHHVQFNVNTTMIFGLDEATIPLKRALLDKDSLSLPHTLALRLGQSNGLDTCYHYVILVNIDLESSMSFLLVPWIPIASPAACSFCLQFVPGHLTPTLQCPYV